MREGRVKGWAMLICVILMVTLPVLGGLVAGRAGYVQTLVK